MKTEHGKKVQKKVAVIPRTVSGTLSNSQQDRNDTSWDVIDLSQPSSHESTGSSEIR